VITSSKVVFSTVEGLLGLCFIRENDAPVGERLLPARKVAAHLCARNMDRENQSDLNSELGSVIHFLFGSALSRSRGSLLGSSNSSFLFQVSI